MKKKAKSAQTHTELFNTAQFSIGVGDIEKNLGCDPAWNTGEAFPCTKNEVQLEGGDIIIPPDWEDKGGLWDTYPQYWIHNNEACFYDGENIFTKNKHEVITNKIKKQYLSPRWYLSYQNLTDQQQIAKFLVQVNTGDRLYSHTLDKTGTITAITGQKFSIKWDGFLKLHYLLSEIEELQLSKIEDVEQCDNSTYVQELAADSALQVYGQDGNLLEFATTMNTVQTSSQNDSPVFPTTETCEVFQCETSESSGDTSISSQPVHHASPLALQEKGSEQTISEIVSPLLNEPLSQSSQTSLLSKTSPACSIADSDQEPKLSISSSFLDKLPTSATMRNGLLYPAATLLPPSLEKDYFWLESPSALSSIGKGRPPGQTKLEAQLKKHGLMQKTEVLNPVILSEWCGLPQNWLNPLECRPATELLESKERHLEIFSILELQPSLSLESNTSQNSLESPTSKKQLHKVVTVRQPHASLFGLHKGFETRSRATNYRGKILIHAAIEHNDTESLHGTLKDLLPPYEELVFGAVVAIADLTDCIKMTEEFITQQSETELRCGYWKPGRYAWKLENVQILDEPIPARGMPGLWEIEIELPSVLHKLSGKYERTLEFLPGNQVFEVSPSEVKIEVNSIIKIRGKDKYGTVISIQGETALVDTFAKSHSKVNLDNLDLACNLKIDQIKFGSFLKLNGKVGEVIECFGLEYLSIRYEDDFKTYFWGQDDTLIKQLEPASAELIENYTHRCLRPGDRVRFKSEVKFKDVNPTDKFPEAAILANKGDWAEVCSYVRAGRVEISIGGTGEPFTWYCKVLKKITESEETLDESATPTVGDRVPRGSLYKYIDNKKLKDGSIVSYPRVTDRDENNISHWRWGYQFWIKTNHRWGKKSIACPNRLVLLVQEMIDKNYHFEEIKNFIQSSKSKKVESSL